ncbi:DJ-1/PfpI family protein [Spirillospora sp. NPDC047279]|uniref:DJ-1/PfpI family protein n=1 Tax=Spirillospora sp. NPDC047279 TaxID=3155478 RepID=UPI003408EEFF
MQVAIAMFPKLTILDAIGPYQVFANMPDAEVVLCAARRGRLADGGTLHLDIDHTFADVPNPDILVVPGGNITRQMARENDPIVEWIRSVHEHTTYTTSVCTGAMLLGAAGLLQGLKATTHWVAYDELRRYGAEPTEQRVVFQDKIVTAAGVSAGIDMALQAVAKLSGSEAAQAIELLIEYDPEPPFGTGSLSKAPQNVKDRLSGLVDLWR